MFAAVMFATIGTLALYLVVGFTRGSRVHSVQDFFLSSQNVSTTDYANTSVGYALQMAAMFLFAYWGMLYGLGALWTAVFWCAGFALLHFLLPRFLDFHAHQVTLHEYLADKFGGGRKLQLIAAIATLIGLWGTMMAEVDYTAQLYAPVVTGTWSVYGLQVFFLVFGTAYIIVNGFKAEVATERYQVPLAYIGLFGTLIFALPNVWTHSGPRAYWPILTIFVIALLVLLWGKLQVGITIAYRDPQLWLPVIALFLITVCHVVITQHLPEGTAPSVLQAPLTTQLKAQGWFPLLSLFLANALWMPVDLSTWQRIASVEGTGDTLLRSLRKGTRRVMLESPATWALGVVLGLIIEAGGFLAGKDPSEGIATFSAALASGTGTRFIPGSHYYIYPLFTAACVAVMLSTVDSIVAAVAYTASRDITRTQTLSTVRLWTLGIVAAGIVVYPVLRITLGASLPVFLYLAYAAQLSLVVVVGLALFKRRLDPKAAFASVVSGIAAAVICAYLLSRIPNAPDSSVLSPIFAIFGAIIGYIAAYSPQTMTTLPTDNAAH